MVSTTHRRRRPGNLIAVLIASMTINVAAHAFAPQLSNILPRGAQRGGEAVVEFHGARLADAVAIVTHEPGITFAEMTAAEDGKATAKLTIAPDARLGTHALRVRTKTGMSNLLLFSVGALTEVQEAEPNNNADEPQAIELNTTVNGVVPSEDVDYFAVELADGQRLAVEAEAIRLGIALFDIKLRLFSPDGHELIAEDDTALMRQDAAFVHTAEKAGQYLIAVSEAAYGGAGNYHYRLHVGEFPRPLMVTPLGGAPGAETKVTWLGDPAVAEQALTLPAVDDGGTATLLPALESSYAPTPVPFRYSAIPGVLEAEPNNSPEQPTAGTAPGAFDGVIGEAGDTDWYQFEGTKDQVFDIRLWARALGSPLDGVMTLSGPDGAQVATDDDARGMDPYFRVTLPAEGLYKIWVADHRRRGGPTYAYRVEVTPVQPALTFRTEKKTATYAVPQNNRTAMLVVAERSEFGGELKIALENLPEGVTAEHAPALTDSHLQVVFNAATDAPLAGKLVGIAGTHGEGDAAITGGFHQQLVLVEGNNQTIFHDWHVDTQALAVTEPAPYSVTVAQPGVPLVRNGYMDLRVTAARAEGFNDKIDLKVLYTPNGIGASTAAIEPDQTETNVRIEAQGNAPLGALPIVIVATSGGWETSTPFVTLDVQEPWVTFTVANIQAEQGQTAEATVTVAQNQPYDGAFKVNPVGLPKGVAAEPQEFTKETTEMKFPVQIAADAPEGKHTSLYMHTTLEVNGEPVHHRSGGAELAIFAPLPAALQEAKPEEPKAEEKKPDEPERKTRFPTN